MEKTAGKWIYYENQKFAVVWLKVIFLVAALYLLFLIGTSSYSQYIKKIPFGNKPVSGLWVAVINIFMFVITALILILLFYTRLIIAVSSNHLVIRYPPFYKKRVRLSNIKDIVPVVYRPIIQFGGWGIRYSIIDRMWAFTISGNKGAIITMVNGKKYLIGSGNPGMLSAVIKERLAV